MQRNRNSIYVLVLVVIGLGVYANTFGNQFVLDSGDFILDWYEIRSLENVPSFFKGSLPVQHVGVYRPVRSVFYALNYKLWLKDPFGYHFNSLLIHLSATILVYFIILAIAGGLINLFPGASRLTLIQSGLIRGSGRNRAPAKVPGGESQTLALMCALLFCVHPIHTESISFIIASFDAIGLVFFLLSFYLYLAAFSGDVANTTSTLARQGGEMAKPKLPYHRVRLGIRGRFAYIGSIIFGTFGFFTYEMALTLPLVLLVHDFCFKRVRYKFYLPYVFSCFIYVFIRVFLLGVLGRRGYFEDSFYLTMLTMSKALMRYISLSIVPVGLNVNHLLPGGILSLLYAENCGEAIRSQSIVEPHVIGSIMLTVLLLVIAVKVRKILPIISFCILWFFVTLLSVSNIVPFQNVMSERYLYLPSVGSCFLLGYLIFILMKSDSRLREVIGVVIFVSIAVFYGNATFVRNKDWRNEMTFLASNIKGGS